MGCRKRYEAKSSAERAGAYYGSNAGRAKKKVLNRKRSLASAADRTARLSSSPETEPIEKFSPLLGYYRWLIGILDGILMNVSELKQVLCAIRAKVRQRGQTSVTLRHIEDE
jgi:hypothetical protein